MPMCNRFLIGLLLLVPSVALAAAAAAQLDFEKTPINYSQATPTDRVYAFGQQLSSGQAELTWDSDHGYLRSILQQLDIPVSSQSLVFSKTSLQVSRISPRTPRAVYFNDDVYVGWVQYGDVIELSAADASLGGTFYALSQKRVAAPAIRRETSHCLQCHGSTHTRRTPGHIVRSVTSEKTGLPVYRLGTHLTDHKSAFSERFGGWYVTGTHGDQRHMGNVWLSDPNESEELDTDAGANVTDLSSRLDIAPYLSPHSDIVALMVLQHQVHMHNVLTAANHSGRLTARDAVVMNSALERGEDFESDSTRRRYDSAAEKVLKALLFCDEHLLTEKVTGTSSFRAEFEARGPFENAGRGLRQFDLKRRLFRYPCSYLIYSEAFQGLPERVRQRVLQRLQEVLSGADLTEPFADLTPVDRQAISQILAATYRTAD